MADKKTAWDFVEEHFPNYHSSNLIGRCNDLHKLINGENEDGDGASKLLESDYDNDDSNPKILIDHNETLVQIYESAIENFYKQQKL